MKKAISLFCVLVICMALLCGCTQTGSVAPQKPEKNPEAWLLQQSRDMIQIMTKANPMLTTPMSEEENDAFDTMKEGLFDHPSAELYLYPNYVPLLDSLQEADFMVDSTIGSELIAEKDPMYLPNLLFSANNSHLAVAVYTATQIGGFLDVPTFLRGNAALLLWHGTNSTAVIVFADRGVGLQYSGGLLGEWSEYADLDYLDKLPREGMQSYDADALEGMLKLEASVPHAVSVSSAKSAEEFYLSSVNDLLAYMTERQNVITKAYFSGEEDLQAAARITGEPERITLYEGVDDRGVSQMIVSEFGIEAARTFNVPYTLYAETCPLAAKNAVAFLEFSDGKRAIAQLYQGEICSTLILRPLPEEAAEMLEERLSGMASNTIELH